MAHRCVPDMMKKLILLFVLILAAAGSVAQDDLPDLPGLIAYIGGDHNVYVIDMHSGNVVQHTDDASDSRHYQWPTWANNNKLAFFCCDASSSGELGADVYISLDGVVPADLAYSAETQTFTYAYWAPGDCELGDKCRDLAVLLGGAGAFDVQLIRVHDEVTNRLMGMGAPFYYSWSPDADQLILQRNGRNLDIYDVAAEETEQMTERPGRIQAPQWSPVDDRLLVGVRDDELAVTDLTILDGDEAEIVADDLSGLVAANWSPDGRYIAYRAVRDDFGDLYVYDTESAEIMLQTSMEGVISFFWSPDSSKIAFITLANAPGASSISTAAQPAEHGMAWWVMDVNTGDTARLVNFVPTLEMLYILNFFDQFAQSHSLWSPDSTHIVYAEDLGDAGARINLLDTTQPDAVPFSITDGVIGIWSYR